MLLLLLFKYDIKCARVYVPMLQAFVCLVLFCHHIHEYLLEGCAVDGEGFDAQSETLIFQDRHDLHDVMVIFVIVAVPPASRAAAALKGLGRNEKPLLLFISLQQGIWGDTSDPLLEGIIVVTKARELS